jgi:hypothetical protein
MYIKSILFSFFLFSTINILAQYKFIGKISNQENNSIIERATIILNNKTKILSDAKGYFEFFYNKDSVSVFIECVGFQKNKEKLLTNKFNNIKLLPQFSVLDEVTVFSGAKNIILKAINAIEDNYPQNNFKQNGYLNFQSNEIQDYPKAYKKINVKALLLVNNTSYKKYSSTPKIDLIANDIIQYNSNTKMVDSINWINGWYYPLNYDIVHNRDYILDKLNLNKYIFVLNGKKSFDGNIVYEILFEGKKESQPSGYLYIDTASYALNFIKYTRKNVKELFYIDVKKSDIEIKYKKLQSKWVLDYLKRESVFEKFHKITYSNATIFYKTIDDKLVDSNLLSINVSNLPVSTKRLNEFDEIRSIFIPSHDSIWLKYRNILDSNFQTSFSENINLDSLPPVYIQNNSNKITNNILNYLRSNKISFGFFYSIVSNPLLNSNSSTFTQHLKFDIFKTLSFNVDISNNFGIGLYNIYRNYLYFSYPIILHKNISFDALFGTSNFNIKNKKFSSFNSSQYITGGLRINKKITKHIFGLFEFNTSDFKFKDHIECLGIIFKK